MDRPEVRCEDMEKASRQGEKKDIRAGFALIRTIG